MMDLKMYHGCLELSRKRNLCADRVVAKKNERKKQEGVAGSLYALVHPSVPPWGGLGSLWTEDGARVEIWSAVRIKALRSCLH